MPTAFTKATFERLGTCETERQSTAALSPLVDRLILAVNTLPTCRRLAEFRDRWSLKKAVTPFFVDRPVGDIDYVRGGKGHWYIYHWGGRWTPQFNIGMFGGRLGERRYVRIGLGFSLTLNSVDPNRDARLQDLRALFLGFQQVLKERRSRMELVVAMQRRGDWILEREGAVPDSSLRTPEAIIDWLARSEHRSGWVFFGRRLSPDVAEQADVLENWSLLSSEIENTFSVLGPVWKATWTVAGH